MPVDSKSSIDGLAVRVALLDLTKARAAGVGFVNLVDACRKLAVDVDAVSSLPPGDPLRTTIFSRLRVLERRAGRAFDRGEDITSEEESQPE